jgi:hypothetical protein
MSSSKTLSSKSTIRHGIYALYAFTPFKLLKTQRGKTYSLILTETAHHKVVNLLWRSRSVKEEFYFNIPAGFSKKIIQPYELYPIEFTKNQDKRYVFESLNPRGSWRYFPEYMEFSWETIKEAYYCAFGWVLLSSKKDNCPLARVCPAREGTPCRYYFGPMAYSRLYNVYPLIRKKYEPPQDKSEYQPLVAIRYKSMPLVTLTYIPNGSFIVFIDGVQFRPKMARMFRYPVLLFLKEGLGFRVLNAPAIQCEFNKDTLRELLQDILKSKPTLAQWIKLKQLLYMGMDGGDNLVKEGRGFDAFKQLREVVENTMPKRTDKAKNSHSIVKAVNETKVDDELIDFASVLFIHSFSHLFLNWISARYGYGKGDIGYYIEHDNIQPIGYKKEGIRIFIFEAAVGGLGYLKSFAQDLLDINQNILNEFIGSEKQGILAILENCEKRSDRALKNLAKELDPFKKNEEINRLIDTIIAAYTRTFANKEIFPHINSIREAIANNLNLTPEARSLLDDLLERGPHCWDGCQLCVMLERDCNYLPFDQPFLVTNRFTGEIIRILKKMVNSPTEVFPLKIDVENEFLRFISTARNSIDIVSPWLSPEIVKELIKKAEENELNVRIITTRDIDNKVHAESLKILRETIKYVKTRISQQLHAKGMLVDGVMLLTGSFNFTITGLKSKVENLTVDFSLQGVRNFKKEFDAMWEKSLPLE